MDVQQHNNSKGGEFYIAKEGSTVARATYMWNSGGDVMTINHTEADESLHGQGAGRDLIAAAVAYARKEKKRIVPSCTFARHEFDKHPEYADVLAL